MSEQRLGEKEEAVAFYERALRTSDRDRHAGRCPPSIGCTESSATPAGRPMCSRPWRRGRPISLERVALNFRLGQLSVERLASPDRAAAAYEQVLESDPRHLPSLRSLEALYEQAKANDKLFENLKAQRELVAGPERERVLGEDGRGLGRGPVERRELDRAVPRAVAAELAQRAGLRGAGAAVRAGEAAG